jgi:pimeloyl-ACP methyl ester carboxylesterase
MKRRGVTSIEAGLVFPGICTQGTSDAIVPQLANCERVTLRSDAGENIAGLFGHGTGSPLPRVRRPTLLFFYGNGMCMAHTLEIFTEFRSLGFNTMLIDYPGFGMSDGKPSETACYVAADLAYEYLMGRSDLANSPIIAAGWSLGAAVAIELAVRKPLAGLATFSAFTSIPSMVRVITRGVPLGLLLNSRFNNLEKFPKVTCPLLMVHGALDRLVPPKMLTQLAKVARGKPTVIRVEGAGHNDLFDTGGEELYREIRSFVATIVMGDQP